MRTAKEVKHILINLYCGTFGGATDELEVWDGPNYDYIVMRKTDGWIATIPRNIVDSYLSEHKPTREKGKSNIIDVFHNFKEPMENDRWKERYTYERPEFAYVEFKLEKGSKKGEVRLLNIIDSSKTGLALLITQKDSDLLEILDEGDKIRDMFFFGIGARIKGDGTVKHMTKIKEGKFKGAYILGVEASDI